MDFIKAHFANNERTVVKAYWQNDKGEEIPQIITADDGNPSWKNLLKYITIDDLHEATYKHIREADEAYKSEIMRIAKERNMLVDIGESNTDAYKKLISIIFNDEDNETKKKENLFMFKLALFEFDKIKESENKELKTNLRKANTTIEALKYAIMILE